MPPETPAARRRRPRSKRPPRRRAPGSESIDIRTSDGWSLRADVHEPETLPIGVAILAHAMMARRTEFERPAGGGLVAMLVGRGWRVVNFDFRGHGDSGPRARDGASYSYDDFVELDLPAVHEYARSQAPRGKPLVLVGHSLGGHVGLAAQAMEEVAFDGIVAIGANIWLRELEPSTARWLVKRASLAAIVAVCRRVGRFPARALRLGSDDESRAYFDDFERFARTGRWTSANGDDYLAALAKVRVPVMQIVSDGDRLACVPESGARFVAHCGAKHELVRVARSDGGGPPPDHMGLVTSASIPAVWGRVEGWMRHIADS